MSYPKKIKINAKNAIATMIGVSLPLTAAIFLVISSTFDAKIESPPHILYFIFIPFIMLWLHYFLNYVILGVKRPLMIIHEEGLSFPYYENGKVIPWQKIAHVFAGGKKYGRGSTYDVLIIKLNNSVQLNTVGYLRWMLNPLSSPREVTIFLGLSNLSKQNAEFVYKNWEKLDEVD